VVVEADRRYQQIVARLFINEAEMNDERDPTNPDDGDDELGLPLVLCRSHGGPFDDEAFRSGWRLGDIGSTLARLGVSALAESIRPHERLQADLLAMAYGYTMTVEPSGDPDWLAVTFTRVRDVA
jgi:hypothetical protein